MQTANKPRHFHHIKRNVNLKWKSFYKTLTHEPATKLCKDGGYSFNGKTEVDDKYTTDDLFTTSQLLNHFYLNGCYFSFWSHKNSVYLTAYSRSHLVAQNLVKVISVTQSVMQFLSACDIYDDVSVIMHLRYEYCCKSGIMFCVCRRLPFEVKKDLNYFQKKVPTMKLKLRCCTVIVWTVQWFFGPLYGPKIQLKTHGTSPVSNFNIDLPDVQKVVFFGCLNRWFKWTFNIYVTYICDIYKM